MENVDLVSTSKGKSLTMKMTPIRSIGNLRTPAGSKSQGEGKSVLVTGPAEVSHSLKREPCELHDR